jgi:2-acylglycerol O-acyltransferase 2
MYMQDAKKERIKLKHRKGFIRAAVEFGLDGGLVPTYHFGNTRIFDFFPQCFESIGRRYRFSFGHMVGRWGLPIPRQVPLYIVMGKAIPVPKLPRDHPEFEATVDHIHKQVVEALQDLYDRHKASYGWGDRPLSIE